MSSSAPILRTWDNARGKVYGGLCYLKGNSLPHFSLTCWYKSRQEEYGGAAHEEILSRFPDLADLAALHLSDINGVPIYALENGFYHLGGTNWERPRFDVAAQHFRISEDAARTLVSEFFGDSFSETGGFMSKTAAAAAKANLGQWVEQQLPRWKAEADACISKHGLIIYGDPLPTPAASPSSSNK